MRVYVRVRTCRNIRRVSVCSSPLVVEIFDNHMLRRSLTVIDFKK